jgi:hypothetical protein
MTDEISAKLAELPHLRTPKLRALWQEIEIPRPAKGGLERGTPR